MNREPAENARRVAHGKAIVRYSVERFKATPDADDATDAVADILHWVAETYGVVELEALSARALRHVQHERWEATL